MTLHIKNMVSLRCKWIVQTEIESMNLHLASITLGEVEIQEDLGVIEMHELDSNLRKYGIELLETRKSILIEKIKNIIIGYVHNGDHSPKKNLSILLTSVLAFDYMYMANLFSSSQGITIEQFYIHHKIERIKELIRYEDLTISEIAQKLNYSSVAHLSNQFKKMTGQSPSHFKKLKSIPRKALEDI